jgi:hypothetical protein
MRMMSFSMTTEAVRNRTKTVTRRLGWWGLKPGTVLQAVEKAQGLKKGEHVKPICVIRVVSVRRERICDFGGVRPLIGGMQDTVGWERWGEWEDESDRECAREGFPKLGPDGFIEMFCEANGCESDTFVNRIQFEYVEP